MKKSNFKGKLNVNKTMVATLDTQQMEEIVAGGVARSRRREGDCRYSRNHYSHCTEAQKHSNWSQCACS